MASSLSVSPSDAGLGGPMVRRLLRAGNIAICKKRANSTDRSPPCWSLIGWRFKTKFKLMLNVFPVAFPATGGGGAVLELATTGSYDGIAGPST